MRKEKIDQENALENEQELLYNTLGKQMDQLNDEKRYKTFRKLTQFSSAVRSEFP